MDPESEKIDEFERYLKVFMWTEVKDASLIRDMHNTDKFADNYEDAAASYLKWLTNGYPKVNAENRETQRQQHLKNLYRIFRTHCPTHDIFCFIDD